jgi:hypothetical protein
MLSGDALLAVGHVTPVAVRILAMFGVEFGRGELVPFILVREFSKMNHLCGGLHSEYNPFPTTPHIFALNNSLSIEQCHLQMTPVR